MSARGLAAKLLRGAIVALIPIALLEVTLVAARRFPSVAAVGPLRRLARELYMLDRDYLQMNAAALRMDPRLGYTLRPGEFRFANTEFDTTFHVNSLGVRDDEASLVRPAIVVLGDSFAMGWGVGQDEAFPQVLERLLGRKVLNTGVSSYGTFRELRLLSEVDTSAANWLVIQFCNNDYFENRKFVDEGPAISPSPPEAFAKAVADYRRQQRYWPGRYAFHLFAQRWTALAGRPAGEEPYPDFSSPEVQRRQADDLVKVLAASPVDLSRFRIVLFELNGYNLDRGLLLAPLRERLRAPGVPASVRRIALLDLASELGPQYWYVLDDHLRASGHRLIAERLAAFIRSAEAGPAAGD
jgi:lysophospholipase L1-like esterase